MPLRTSVIRIKGRANDISRRLMEEPGARTFLLKRAGETKRFTLIRELTKGHRVYYSDWRQQLTFEYPTLDSTFRDDAAQTSFLAYGVGRGVTGNVFDVYGVDPDRRDVVPPTADNPAWKMFFTRLPNERFTLLTIDNPPPPGGGDEGDVLG